ncbi:MAG: 16S rRNA (cytosine(967)-C(5))-methyltransferase RsmB [Firmicutes bacterium]|nr:16S rRNA (cytosine(967)-C(5))-methyltransferase RsmB [Bacillota bacterium]
MKKKHLSAREAALLALESVLEEGAYVNLALAKVLSGHALDERDRRLVAEITYGVVTYKLTLDWIIMQLTGRPADKLDRPVLLVLYIGLYQLFYLDKIPAPAAVHTSVELIKKTKKRALAGFVNGVLRGALRRKNNLPWPDKKEENTAEYLSLRYAHPLWMVKRWLDRLGPEETEKLLAANNMAPPVTIRVNTLRTDRESLLSRLAAEGVEAEASGITPEAIIIKSSPGLGSLASYKDGLFQVQGESAILASRILAPAPGSRVLDMCSAPGGKTTHLAALMQNRGEIVALDIYPHRLELVKANARRLGAAIITTVLLDGREITPGQYGLFNYILLDAPCTCLGVIRRKPDIKWRRREKEIGILAALQKELLERAAAVLAPDGVLVYSTCTNEPEETTEQIDSFLERHPEFTSSPFTVSLPPTRRQQSVYGGIQLYPHVHGVDGFFLARLRKAGR